MNEKERMWYELGYTRGMTVGIAIFVAFELVFGFLIRGALK